MFSSHLTWLLSGIWPSWLLPVPWGSFLIWIGFHDASLSRVVILCLWWPLLSFVCEMFILYLSLRCWSPWGPFLLLSCIFHPHGLSEKSYSRFWLPHTSWRCPMASPLPLFKIFDSLLNILPKSTRLFHQDPKSSPLTHYIKKPNNHSFLGAQNLISLLYFLSKDWQPSTQLFQLETWPYLISYPHPSHPV